MSTAFIYWTILSTVILALSGKRALEKTCETFPNSFFHGHSCFIGSSGAKKYSIAKADCQKPKPNLPMGRLAYILTEQTLDVFCDSVADGKLAYNTGYFIGLEQIPANDESEGGTKGWTWTHPNLPNRPVPHHDIILWYNVPPQPHNVYSADDVATIYTTKRGIVDANAGWNYHYLCQYEEPTFRMYHRCSKNKIGHNTTIIAQHDSLTRAECAQKCGRDLMCRSFSFNQVTGHCLTHWTDGGVANFEQIERNGYNFFLSDYSYNKKTDSFCPINI